MLIRMTDHGYGATPSPPWLGSVGDELPRASGGDAARTIVAGSTRATLSTLAIDPAGYPFGSVVSYALDAHGHPLMVISTMAEHTRNATADSRASLLVTEPADGVDPLAVGRVTLIGDLSPVAETDRAEAIEIVRAVVPGVAVYAGFADFAPWRLRVSAIRWVGGFGAMSWISVDDYRTGTVDCVLPERSGITAHMNEDHADACILICGRAMGRHDVVAATFSHVDRFGCDLVAEVPEGRMGVRVAFDKPVASSDAVRAAVVALVRRARSADESTLP
jgi:putative heme iron utilization protein